MMDAASLSVPLWSAVTAGGVMLGMLAAAIAWAFSTFERKEDATCKEETLEGKVESLEKQSNEQWTVLRKVSSDVSYIRGRLESEN